MRRPASRRRSSIPTATTGSTTPWADALIISFASNSSRRCLAARANWVFTDNSASAQGAIGVKCQLAADLKQYTDTTIGDLLSAANVPWVWYGEGYQRAKDAAANGNCMSPDPACAAQYHFYPCTFDPGDVPFDYYASTVDAPDHMKDLDDLTSALASVLPARA